MMTGPVSQSATPDSTLPSTYSYGHQEWSHFCSCSSELDPQPQQEPGVLEAGETRFQDTKINKWTHLSQFQACLSIFCKWHTWHCWYHRVCFCFSSFYFAGLASSPRQKTYLHLSPQSRLFPGTLYVVMVLPSVILTHAWACLSLSPGHAVPSRGQVVPGYWPKHALSLRAGVCPMGPPGAQKSLILKSMSWGYRTGHPSRVVSLLGWKRSLFLVQSGLSKSPLSWWCIS